MDKVQFDFKQLIPILVILVALLGLIFIVADWEQIQTAVMQASWKPIPFALAATLVSYACISFSFAQVSKLLGVKMQTKELAIVGYVGAVLNHIVLSGGTAGYAVRFMLMNRHGVTMREVVAISILHFYLTALFMVSMLPFGFVYLGVNAAIGQTATILVAVSALILLVVAILATGLIFGSKVRKRGVRALVKVTDTVLHRDIREPLERFDETMDRGVQAMREKPSSVVIIAALVVVDWVFSAVTLWFCFRAFDLVPSAGQLVSGFVIGTVAGQASMLPGGLGTQEASLSGIFALYGFPFETAALTSVLYRVVYSIVPYLVSLAFYRLVLRRQEKGQSALTQEEDDENPYA